MRIISTTNIIIPSMHKVFVDIFTFYTLDISAEGEALFTAPFILLMIVEFFVEAPISSHFEDLLSPVSFCS